YAVGQTTYKWGATDPLSESTNAQIILDFKNGRGYYCSHPFISSLSGNAATATKLQTARTIGGVSFDGTANINLPGVNTTGNQNTTGNAATATKLQTARTINGVSFDGTKDITLTPKDLDAYSKSEVQSALAGKQPLDNTLTNLSGKDVAGLLAYLGLGEAAKRDVGTGENQIPDMGAFTSGSGWFRIPSGYIVQFGTFRGNTDRVISGSFPIPFPNQPSVSVGFMSDSAQSTPSHPTKPVLSVNFEHVSNSEWRAGISDSSQQFRFGYISIGW
ncbi:gp53-like domain-containing protein, partial [Escherichia coli]